MPCYQDAGTASRIRAPQKSDISEIMIRIPEIGPVCGGSVPGGRAPSRNPPARTAGVTRGRRPRPVPRRWPPRWVSHVGRATCRGCRSSRRDRDRSAARHGNVTGRAGSAGAGGATAWRPRRGAPPRRAGARRRSPIRDGTSGRDRGRESWAGREREHEQQHGGRRAGPAAARWSCRTGVGWTWPPHNDSSRLQVTRRRGDHRERRCRAGGTAPLGP